ncbi:hypothetical protein Tco_1326274 [Tanacetum coccineum]
MWILSDTIADGRVTVFHPSCSRTIFVENICNLLMEKFTNRKEMLCLGSNDPDNHIASSSLIRTSVLALGDAQLRRGDSMGIPLNENYVTLEKALSSTNSTWKTWQIVLLS